MKVFIPWSVLNSFKALVHRFEEADYVVGVLRGGAVPAVCASHSLEKPVYWVEASSYDESGIRHSLSVSNVNAPLLFGDLVLIVDDIYDTGTTLEAVLDMVAGATGRVPYCAVLVTKRPVECAEKGISFVIATPPDCWVVFPWEGKAEGGVKDEKVHRGGTSKVGGVVSPREVFDGDLENLRL